MYSPINSIDQSHIFLDLISARQEAVSANVVNMDTPGYVRKDVQFSQYLDSMNSGLETDLSLKMGPSGLMQEAGAKLSVEDELAIMQKNSILYSVAVKKMSSAITEIKTVINVGS